MNKNTKVIYKRNKENMYEKGYVDLKNKSVNTADDLVEIASIFRDERFETFRVVYMNDNLIVGYESISSKLPNQVSLFKPDKRGKINSIKNFYKINNRMKRLNANSYYLVHNHPSNNAKASDYDIKATINFANKIKGFKGHLIVNKETYAWIDVNKYGFPEINNYMPINKENIREMDKCLKEKSIYEVKILNRDTFISLMHNIKNSKEYSIAILTNGQGKIKMILDIPNRMINMPKEELRNYFRNLAKMNGVNRVFFSTDNEEVYENAKKHLEYGTFKDLIYYQNDKEKGIRIKAEDSIKSDVELFDENIRLSFAEKNEEYKVKEKLKIVMKRVGKEPKVMNVENTLEAKQKLVNGLIEVLPVTDDILLICNEEGKIENLLPNLVFDYDYIVGDCFFVGDDYENGDFKSLTDEQVKEVFAICQNRQFINFFDIDEKEFE